MMVRLLITAALFFASASAYGGDARLWAIYWMTEAKVCSNWGNPLTSIYYAPCIMNGVAVSICPNMGAGGWNTPYSQGHSIKVRGVQASQMLTDPTASGYFVVGSASVSMPGADVFASHAGVGSHSFAKNAPEHLPLYQGNPVAGDTSHIDVYASCDKGQYQMLVVLEYEDTSP